MKRSRDAPRVVEREEEEEDYSEVEGEDGLEDADLEAEEAELLAEAQAAGLIGQRAPGSGVDAREALRESYRSFAQDLPWVERLEVVSADPLGVVNAADDLKLELAL